MIIVEWGDDLMKKRFMIALTILMVLCMLQTVYSTYSAVFKEDEAIEDTNKTKEVPDGVEKINSKAMTTGEVQIVEKQPKKEIDINHIKLAADVESTITKQDSTNAAKNIKNFKTLLAERGIPEKLKVEVEKRFKKGYRVPDVLIAYEFLYDNYGQASELEILLDKKKSGKSWVTIFKEYSAAAKPFTPKNFKPGEIDDLVKAGMTLDDIMIADRISQKGLKGFDELIALRKEGKIWQQINADLEILNTAERLPRIAVTSTQVKEYMTTTRLTEEQVINALTLAQKLGKSDEEMLKKVKSGSKNEDIFAESVSSKYN